MISRDAIRSAIASHGAWKTRLEAAVAQGSSEYSPAVVQTDDQCAFGKFLYQEVDPDTRSSPHYARCKELHQRFHLCAARIWKLGLAGKKEKARQALASGTGFTRLSGALTPAMLEWSRSVE